MSVSAFRYTDFNSTKAGSFGHTLINDTNPHTGAWVEVQCFGATATLTMVFEDNSTISGLVFAIGQKLAAPITSITITAGSGVIVAAKAAQAPVDSDL